METIISKIEKLPEDAHVCIWNKVSDAGVRCTIEECEGEECPIYKMMDRIESELRSINSRINKCVELDCGCPFHSEIMSCSYAAFHEITDIDDCYGHCPYGLDY